MSDWQPIETAPRDGTAILAWDGEEEMVLAWTSLASWNGEERWTSPGDQWDCSPTHWMPLPEPPHE